MFDINYLLKEQEKGIHCVEKYLDFVQKILVLPISPTMIENHLEFLTKVFKKIQFLHAKLNVLATQDEKNTLPYFIDDKYYAIYYIYKACSEILKNMLHEFNKARSWTGFNSDSQREFLKRISSTYKDTWMKNVEGKADLSEGDEESLGSSILPSCLLSLSSFNDNDDQSVIEQNPGPSKFNAPSDSLEKLSITDSDPASREIDDKQLTMKTSNCHITIPHYSDHLSDCEKDYVWIKVPRRYENMSGHCEFTRQQHLDAKISEIYSYILKKTKMDENNLEIIKEKLSEIQERLKRCMTSSS